MRITRDCAACVAIQMHRTMALRAPQALAPFGEMFTRVGRVWGEADNPGDVLTVMYDAARDATEDGDPYATGKVLVNRLAQQWLAQHPVDVDALAVRLARAVAGNAIDAGVDADAELIWARFQAVEAEALGLDDRPRLLEWLAAHGAAHIVYLLDNNGEVVFDREVMVSLRARGHQITAVVKGRPIINDVTRSDAVAVGIDRVAEIIDNGSDAIGLHPKRTRPAVWDLVFSDADLVIAKGLSHLETLSHRPTRAPTAFLYMAKCPPSARLAGVSVNEGVCAWREAGTVWR